jgi:hypothetical protein
VLPIIVSLVPFFVLPAPSLIAFVEVKQLTYPLFIRPIVISNLLVVIHMPFFVAELIIAIRH